MMLWRVPPKTLPAPEARAHRLARGLVGRARARAGPGAARGGACQRVRRPGLPRRRARRVHSQEARHLAARAEPATMAGTLSVPTHCCGQLAISCAAADREPCTALRTRLGNAGASPGALCCVEVDVCARTAQGQQELRTSKQPRCAYSSFSRSKCRGRRSKSKELSRGRRGASPAVPCSPAQVHSQPAAGAYPYTKDKQT